MKEWRGIPREEVPWFPTIDQGKCTGCQTCMTFCKNDVLVFEEKTGRVRVANAYNCVVECSTCARLCPSEAISFPVQKDFAEWLKTYQSKGEDTKK